MQRCSYYYDFARRNDIYLSYAVTPPSGLRSAQLFPGQQRDDPSLKVTGEYDGGLILSGMKMLATGAVFADEVWVGNLAPLDDKRNAESITCAIPMNASGLSLWARQPYALHAANATDYPLSYRFDETDSVLVCENVKVPWERIFLHDNGAMSRAIYLQTPANCYANHQSNVRFWAKMGLIVGLASRACIANGVDKIPAVRETLGRLAALEATIGGLGARPDRCVRAMAGRLRDAESADHVCDTELVPGASQRDRRHPALADGRRSAADAGKLEYRRRRKSRVSCSNAGGAQPRSERWIGCGSTSSAGT